MKIVDQARLWFREGKSDKVYEVDLVEVASGQYVVNFRYGRRGSALRDGTRTPLPVPLDKARAIFSELVAEKTRGGYRTSEEPAAGAATALGGARPAPAHDAPGSQLTRRRLLARLRQGHRGEGPLHVVVRRVGELAMSEAEPVLLELLTAAPPPGGMKAFVWQHLVVCALARCGSSASVAPLERMAAYDKPPLHLRDAARLALSMITGEAGRSRTLTMAREALPPDLRAAFDARDATRMIGLLELLAADAPEKTRAAVMGLHLAAAGGGDASPADDTARAARTAVMAAARVLRFTRQEFGILRALFWSAELRRDGELYALLGRRIEDHRGTDACDEATRNYLRRRMARTLRRLGSVGSPDYVAMASAILETYRDADAEPVRRGSYGTYDAFARYHALNQILYRNSPRYERAHHRQATWKLRAAYPLGGPLPRKREEDHPELWDRAPAVLWRLARRPLALPVLQFATRALRDHAAFLDAVPAGELADAMALADPLTQAVAFEAALRRPLDAELARGAAASTIEAAHGWVMGWARANPQVIVRDPAWLALLATARAASLREVLEQLELGAAQAIEPAVAEQALERAIATLIGFPVEEEARAAGARATVVRVFDRALGGVSLGVVRELLGHPLAAVAAVGAEIVLRKARLGQVPTGLLDALLASPHASVRSVGARILGETPPEIMKDHPELLVTFALSENVELRQGTRALLGEVARRYPEVGRRIADQLVDALLRAQAEGAPAHAVSLLRTELSHLLPARDKQAILALLGALSPHAREAGGLLLPQLTVDDLTLEEIVRLASNEILLVRQGAWQLARAALDRFQLAPVALARLCDARWDDSRDFAFELVNGLAREQLSTDAIIAICDSTRPAVQAFGQSLLLRHFRVEEAGRYVLRLAEHPSTNIQLLVSGLLDQHARGNAQVIESLLPYFYTVLSQVNRGAVAKQRVIDFVREQALSGPELAALLGPLLDRQSATSAITQKHPLIATMAALRERRPEVPLPLAIVEPGPLSAPATAAAASAIAKAGGQRAV